MLTDEQKRELRVKVAKAMGWQNIYQLGGMLKGYHERLYRRCMEIPELTLDLMHEAEKLIPEDLRDSHHYFLQEIVFEGKSFHQQWHVYHATATERAQAFVKVMERE